MSELISGIMSSLGPHCYTDVINSIEPCGDENLQNIEASNGECYEYVSTLDYWDHVQCGEPQITECHLYNTICWELVNGVWTLKVTPLLPRIPTFLYADPDCSGLCDVLTD